jgi:hypothetical protein
MSIQNFQSHSNLVGRRAELMAELFLQELDAAFVSRPTQDFGYDLLVGFPNERAGINTFAVEVKATTKPVGSRISIPRRAFDRIAHSNVPGFLLVADVKQNKLYYAWLKSNEANSRGGSVSIPLVEINQKTREELRRQFHRANGGAAVAG